MTGIDYILEGLEAELALERALGVRDVEIDRALLTPPAGGTTAPASAGGARGSSGSSGSSSSSGSRISSSSSSSSGSRISSSSSSSSASSGPRAAGGASGARAALPFVFLHDRALTPAATEMMAKIVKAMGATAETAPIVFTGARPAARVYVVLGGYALRKWFPGVPGAPGQWIRAEGAPNVLVTYSPLYLLRFAVPGEAPSPALQKMKRDMWTALKGVMRRAGGVK